MILGTVVLGALLGGLAGTPVQTQPEQAELTAEEKGLLSTFTDVLAQVEERSAVEKPTPELVENAIRGMLRTLDPHSSFFSTEDFNRLQEEQKGKYYGLGITIRAESPGSGRVVIVEPPAPGTPAFKAGLRAGDVIARIEGEPIDDWDLNEEVIPSLKGPKGTKVNITVERPGVDTPLEFTVERDEIPLYSIKYAFHIAPGIGYIRILRFGETTGDELDAALEKLDEANLKGLILDLRDNPGGALSQALAVADRFLDRGQKIVATRSRNGKENRDYRARREQRYHYPMVVLINENSASASEIVSGALQDHDRALIIGETSFGKALVQTIFPLEGQRALALTTGRYYTPSDRLIQRDYSGGFLDYYAHRGENSEPPEARPRYRTDGGRLVFGGGGITPDEIVEPTKVPLLVRKIQGRNLFRTYAAEIYAGKRPSTLLANLPESRNVEDPAEIDHLVQLVQVDDAELARFRKYVEEAGVTIPEAEWKEAGPIIVNFLRQEALLLAVGDEASYRVALELDRQVQRAIEVVPNVDRILQSAIAEARQEAALRD
ncbi:MAG: hypothetical protein Kow00109_07810 [Acidobacteriota bacterium]